MVSPVESSESSPVARGTKRLVAFLVGTALALLGAVVYLAGNRADPRELLDLALESDEVREAAMAALVGGGAGAWDSFPDPDVGRILQRRLEGREFRGVPVSSNAFGMREGGYAARKPEGTTRIVVLGDSFVFGYRTAAEDRVGVFLERFLRSRGASDDVEVLHIAASSWNILAETSYLRRQLHALQPDLVVHVVVSNDLDDTAGVRGFGSMGATSPQVPRHVTGLVSTLTPPKLWPRRLLNYMLFGLDHESRERYGRAAEQIARLAVAVEDRGGQYLMLVNWETFNPMVAKHFAPLLERDQVAYVSPSFARDPAHVIDPADRHWNPAGHESIAKLIFGLAVRRDLLPALSLEPWAEASATVAAVHERGLVEASHIDEYDASLLEKAAQIRSSIDFANLDRRGVKQVHGGLSGDGLAAPYASLVLARGNGDELVVRGARLDRGLLADGVARVSVEGIAVGTIALSDDELAFEERWPLPADARDRAFLTVRFESDDYLYVNAATGTCASFRLDRAAIE